jgi:Flp pilus assembly protein TadD
MNTALQRAMVLVEQGRLAEAEQFLREAIEFEPQNPRAFFLLACCLTKRPETYREAERAIDEALRLRPNDPLIHCQRSSILLLLNRPKDALLVAREARRLDPGIVQPYAAEAAALLALGRAREAESLARQALAIDPEYEPAGNQLAHALRLQGKLIENEKQIRALLARNPENERTHVAAGWSALQRGRVSQAEKHFFEALRLNPEADYARDGLLSAFRARSPLYRLYLYYCLNLQGMRRYFRWPFVLGLLLVSKAASGLFMGVYAPIGWGLILLYVLFGLWVWVARSVGNLFLLFDQFARRALLPAEKWEACVVGGGVLLGLPMFVVGLCHHDVALLLGVTLLGSAFPMSLVFTNPSRIGRILFMICGSLVYLLGLIGLFCLESSFDVQDTLAATAFCAVILVSVATTWLGNIPRLRQAW